MQTSLQLIDRFNWFFSTHTNLLQETVARQKYTQIHIEILFPFSNFRCSVEFHKLFDILTNQWYFGHLDNFRNGISSLFKFLFYFWILLICSEYLLSFLVEDVILKMLLKLIAWLSTLTRDRIARRSCSKWQDTDARIQPQEYR